MEMAMMSTLVMIGIQTEPLDWIQVALSDYYSHINRVDGESHFEKKERITVANTALLEMLKYLDTILNFTASRKTLTTDEFNLINSWLISAIELFPKNKHEEEKKEAFDNSFKHHNTKHTEMYEKDEMDFPPAKPVVRSSESSSLTKTTSVWGTQITKSVVV
jgi:hypothetical protein